MMGNRLEPASGITAPPGAWRQADDEDLSPILATARDLFYEVGFHGTTVRDIAGRGGVTVPALYYHHANKEAILSALLDRSISSVITRCEQALHEAGDDPAARFRNLIECLALYMANHRKSAAMDAEIRALSPAARKLYSLQRRRVEQMLADTISQGVTAGEFEMTSPSDTGRALLGMIQAITLWFIPGGGPLTASELARRYVDIAGRTVGLRDRREGAAELASDLASRLLEWLGCLWCVDELAQGRARGDEPVVGGLQRRHRRSRRRCREGFGPQAPDRDSTSGTSIPEAAPKKLTVTLIDVGLLTSAPRCQTPDRYCFPTVRVAERHGSGEPKRGANEGRSQATRSHHEPLSTQVNATPANVRRHTANLRS